MSTTAERGYGYRHRRERARWALRVAHGDAVCARCGNPILPGQPWHLDHDSYDRTRYIGASCVRCNCGEPAKRRRKRRVTRPNWSRNW